MSNHSRSDYRRWSIWRRLGIGVLVLAAVAALAYALRVPTLQWIGHQLVRSDLVETSDAILVLSGGSGERELETADLYAAHAAPLVILTTERDPKALPELLRRGAKVERGVDWRKRILQELGVPASAIVALPGEAKSTNDEANDFVVWVKTHPVKSILIVTSVFHTRRAGFIFERTLRDSAITIRVRPSSIDRYNPDDWWTDRNTLLEGLVEWQKTVFYRLRY